MSDEIKWDKNKHDDKIPKDPLRVAIKCKCGGTQFVQIKSLEIVVVPDVGAFPEFKALYPMCAKCNTGFNLTELTKQIWEQHGKGNHGGTPQAPPESK